jgi:hypothetical protein
MKMLNRKELKGLVENPKGPCVSIFMPTHFKGPETQQDPIRLKNLLRAYPITPAARKVIQAQAKCNIPR